MRIRRTAVVLAILFGLLLNVTAEEWISLNGGQGSSSKPAVNYEKQSQTSFKTKLKIDNVQLGKQVVDQRTFDTLSIPSFYPSPTIGKPSVVHRVLQIEIPAGFSAVVNMVGKKSVELRNLNIVPVQPPFEDVGSSNAERFPNPAFTQNQQTYATDSFYPAKHILSYKIVKRRNHSILEIDISPVRYNPVTKVAEVCSELELSVNLLASATRSGGERLKGSRDFDKAFSTTAFSMIDPATRAGSTADNSLEKYMLMYDDQFVGNAKLNEFIDWKKRKGYDLVEVKTSDIPAVTKGAPTYEEIKAYMQGLSAADYPTYLLILGDETLVGGIRGFEFDTRKEDSRKSYSDLYFACRDNSDYYPDLFHGRLPAQNNTELTRMLTHVLDMDRTPPASGMYDKVIVAGQIQDSDNGDNTADRLFCETSDVVANYFEKDSGGVDYSCTRAIVNPNRMTAEGKWNGLSLLWKLGDKIGDRIFNTFVDTPTALKRISDSVNNGVAILHHRDHGWYNGWGDPRFTSDHVRGLHNGNLRPLVFSINCLTGNYNYGSNNFMMRWMTHSNGGAYAVICPVNTSYSWDNDWLTHGFYAAMFPDYISTQNSSKAPEWSKKLPEPRGFKSGSAQRLGQVLNLGKQYYSENFRSDLEETTYRLFHCFGDPEAFVRLHKPKVMNISHASIVVENQLLTVNAEDGAMVSLYAPAPLNFHKVKICKGNSVDFVLDPAALGMVNVTVTKYDRATYEGTVEVRSSSQPVIWLSQTRFQHTANIRGTVASDSFTVKNKGVGTLNYTVTTDANWVSCTPSSGTSTGDTDTDTVAITYNVVGLAAGNYVANITVADPFAASPQSIVKVNLTVYPKEVFPANREMPMGWITTPDAHGGWEVSEEEKSEGKVSLKSVKVVGKRHAATEFTGTFLAGNVTFKAKVSSEERHDFLQFYIDDVKQAEWAGDLDWARHSYPISAGQHTVKWVYQKDWSDDKGSDCAWIDEVVLPLPVVKYGVNFTAQSHGQVNGMLAQSVVQGQSTTEVTAVPAAGYEFLNWTGDYTGTTNPLTVYNVSKAMNVTANFRIKTYQVTFNLDGKGTQTGGGALTQSVNHGASAASPQVLGKVGWVFTGWNRTFSTVNSAFEVTALYAEVEVTGTGGGDITNQLWKDIPGGSVADLTKQAKYPASPDSENYLTNFSTPSLGDRYGQRVYGYVHPPVTGDYTFWIAGDDSCELWLSTDSLAVNKVKVAYVVGYTSDKQWNRSPTQKSVKLHLEAGKMYYIEALHKEGGGGDHLAVAWETRGIPRAVIEGQYLTRYFAPSISGTFAHWKLDEEANEAIAADSSGHNHQANVKSGTFGNGHFGGGITMDGNDWLDCGSGAALAGESDFTVSAWFKTSDTTSEKTIIGQCDSVTNGSQGQYRLIVEANGAVKFFTYEGGESSVTTTATFNDGNWHHAVATRANGVHTVYVDGIKRVAEDMLVCELNTNVKVAIGKNVRNNDKYFIGALDDVRIYKHALRQPDVEMLYKFNPPHVVTDITTLNVSEGGDKSFKVKLSAAPFENVSVVVKRSKGDADVSVDAATSNLLFTITNWNQWQTVRVQAAEDNTDVNNGTAVISCTAEEVIDKKINATEVDNDFGVSVIAGTGGVTNGGGILTANQTSYTITATPASGYRFVNWSGADVSKVADVNSPSTTITTSVAASVRANFEVITYSVTFNVGSHGTRSGGGVLSQNVTYNTAAVAPTVTAKTGWKFIRWDKAFDHVTGNISVTAQYEQLRYLVTFVLGTEGSRTGEGALQQSVPHGTSALLPQVVGKPGWRFTGWSGSSSNVTSVRTITATYIALNYQVTASSEGQGTVTPSASTVSHLESIDLTMTPAKDWMISSIKVNGVALASFDRKGFVYKVDRPVQNVNVEVKFSLNCYQCRYVVKAGWNLLSLPTQFKKAPKDLFKTKTGEPLYAGTIWIWNSAAQKYEVANEVCPSMSAVWLFASNDGQTEEFDIDYGQSASITLQPGWNLFGPVEECGAPKTGTVWTWADGGYVNINTPRQGYKANKLYPSCGYWFFSQSGGKIELK